jgi:hypothetical protein
MVKNAAKSLMLSAASGGWSANQPMFQELSVLIMTKLITRTQMVLNMLDSANEDMTATRKTVRHLTCWAEGFMTQNIYGKFLFIAKTFWWLGCKIRTCRTVWPNRKDMPPDFGLKQLKLKRGDVRIRTRGGLRALVWKDRWEVYMLTNMHPPPAEGDFCGDSNHTVKPYIMGQ